MADSVQPMTCVVPGFCLSLEYVSVVLSMPLSNQTKAVGTELVRGIQGFLVQKRRERQRVRHEGCEGEREAHARTYTHNRYNSASGGY